MKRDFILNQIYEQMALLTGSRTAGKDAKAVVQKLMTLEFNFDPRAPLKGQDEIFSQVVTKLIHFYKDKDLEDLWIHYVLLDGHGAFDENEELGEGMEEEILNSYKDEFDPTG